MSLCPASLNKVPEDLHNLPPKIAFSVLIRAVLSSQETYFECARRHQELVRWIEDGQ